MTTASHVKCLCLPLHHAAMLLPASMVHEILPRVAVQPTDSDAAWHSGWLSLRGHKLPVLCLEALLGLAPLPPPRLQQHLAIVHDIDNAAHFGLRLSGLPRIRNIDAADLLQVGDSQSRWGQWVYYQEQRTLVPDWQTFTQWLHDADLHGATESTE